MGDPPYVLKKVLAEAESMGWVMAGPELEFFLFRLDEQGRGTTAAVDKAATLTWARWTVENRPAAILWLPSRKWVLKLKLPIIVAYGQHEIGFKYDYALSSADRVNCQICGQTIARQHGLLASFMPKPVYGQAGSGMHTHFSLVDQKVKTRL